MGFVDIDGAPDFSKLITNDIEKRVMVIKTANINVGSCFHRVRNRDHIADVTAPLTLHPTVRDSLPRTVGFHSRKAAIESG